MNITKDPKIINCRVIDKKANKVISFDVGPNLGEVEGNVSYDAMIRNIEAGQRYEVQAYADADPSNVTVKDAGDGQKILVTGRDASDLNNLDDVKTRYINESTEEELKEKEQVPEGAGTEGVPEH